MILKDPYWIQVSLGLVKRLTASLYNFASFSTVRKFFMTNPFITNNSMNSLRSINNAWSIMSSKESSTLKASYIEKIEKKSCYKSINQRGHKDCVKSHCFHFRISCLAISDEPEPVFSSSSWAELWRFRAEPSRAGAL